jgi:hypothetical protein
MENNKVKVSNPYNFRQGLRLMDGVREVIVHPKSFVLLDADEVYYINNMSSVFARKKLIVSDDTVNQNLGIDIKEDIVSLNDKEIKEILAGNFMTMKKKLSDVTDKHLINRVVEIARDVEDLAQGKLKFLQEISGYDFDQLMKSE